MRNELEGIVSSSMLKEGKSNSNNVQIKYSTMIDNFDTYFPVFELRAFV
jgi:hypothetical protein